MSQSRELSCARWSDALGEDVRSAYPAACSGDAIRTTESYAPVVAPMGWRTSCWPVVLVTIGSLLLWRLLLRVGSVLIRGRKKGWTSTVTSGSQDRGVQVGDRLNHLWTGKMFEVTRAESTYLVIKEIKNAVD